MHASLKDKFDYGKYVIKHKINMIGPGMQVGVGVGTLIKHDIDKFRPAMFGAYADWFKGPGGVNGTRDPKVFKKFRKQVKGHYGRSAHHAYKVNKSQPMNNQLEALVDWYSVTKTTGKTKKKFPQWYKENRNTLPLTSAARQTADKRLGKYF